jgi:hypothetical protein
MVIALCASLVSLSPVLAAGADGEYKFVSASGSVTAAGETIQLDDEILQQFGGLQNGNIVIKDNKLQLNRKAAQKLIKQLADEIGAAVEISISGPTSVMLKKSGKAYTGSTNKPLVLEITASLGGREVTGNIKSLFGVKVKSENLSLKVTLNGTALGGKLTGDITIKCKK